MPVIGQDTLDRVRRETAIVELIGESVKLQRRGRSYVGLCPFHKEKSPSFHVNAERGFYHCFGCHESGDAIKFVQRVEGLEFLEAVRQLAQRAGIEIVETISDNERKQQAEVRRREGELYELGNAAAAFFERMLREHPLGGHAQAELERRGLGATDPNSPIADARQAFRIGYAPYGWDALTNHLREARLSFGAAEKIGLVAPRKSGSGYYDRFRHRLMFAVLDLNGRVIAFSGRTLDEPDKNELLELGIESMGTSQTEAPAKYVNSPESPIYKKREAVFGLYQARSALRNSESAVIVEGNFDVMSLHAHGIKNVVAPLGTAFTVEQAKQIRRFTQDITLFFDGDSAGRRATRAAREVCREAGLSVKVATLPDGVDPDDLVRKQGAEGVLRVIKAARPMLEYLIDSTLDSGFTAEDARGRAAKIKEVTDLINSEDDQSVRALAERHADRIAERLGINDARSFRALSETVRLALTGNPQANRPEAQIAPPNRARSRDRRTEIGLEILGALLDYPELLEANEAIEGAGLLEGDQATALAALRHAWNGKQLDPEQVLAKLSPSIHPFALARLTAPRHEKVEDARTELLGNVTKLRALEDSRLKSQKLGELDRARAAGDDVQQDKMLLEMSEKAKARLAQTRKRA
jgi:DNA primase